MSITKQRRFRPFLELLERREMLDAQVYHLEWDPLPGANLQWSVKANWVDDDTQQRADHVPGEGGPNAADMVTFNEPLPLCQVLKTEGIASLDLTLNYKGTIELFAGANIVVTGTTINNVAYGGKLQAGTIDVDRGGLLIYEGPQAVATWGGVGFPAGGGTQFTIAGGTTPGGIVVKAGASLTATGGDHTMNGDIQIGESLPTEPPSTFTLDPNMTGNINFGAKGTVDVEPGGELHLNTNGDDSGTAGGLLSTNASPATIRNLGLIERNGTGVANVSFPIANTTPASTLRVDSGTLAVLNANPVSSYAVSQTAGTTLLKDGTTLQVTAGSGYQIAAGTFTAVGIFLTTVDGSFTQSGGTATMQSFVRITGKYQKTGGDLILQGNGPISFNQGLQQDGGSTTLASLTTCDVTGSLVENGGTITLGDGGGSSTITTTAGVQVAAGAVLSGSASITGDVTTAGEVDSGGALAVSGSYTQTAGRTTVNGGTFTVSAGLVAQGGTLDLYAGWITVSGDLQVQSAAALYGAAVIFVSGDLTNAGVIAIDDSSMPGFLSPSTLTVTGNYTQTSTGTLDLRLGSISDALWVSGLATLDGTLNVVLVNGFTPSPFQVFQLVMYGSRSGTFAALNLPSPGQGSWSARYDDPSYLDSFTLWDLMSWGGGPLGP